MSLDAGALDREVTIQQVTSSIGTSGFPVETWSTLVAAEWMQKMDVRGRERFAAGQHTAPYDTRWVLWYRDDMDPEVVDVAKTRRLSYQGRFYDIVSATLIGRYEGIELLTLVKAG